MNPSQVEPTGRAMMGAIKRSWDRGNTTATTDAGGTSTAYTLTYSVAAAAYYSGEEFAIYIDKTCGATPSLNINSLGAANFRKFSAGSWVTLSTGDLAAGQSLRVAYNASATTFDIVAAPVALGGWQPISTSLPSGVASVSFQSIPTSINALQILFDLTLGTNNDSLGVQFYNSGGTLDTGASAYYYLLNVATTTPGNSAIGATAGSIVVGLSIGNTSTGLSGDMIINNIQGVKSTQCNFRAHWKDQTGALYTNVNGSGGRIANGNITGVKLFVSGTMTGRITLLGSTN
jgi:hypothetical protein